MPKEPGIPFRVVRSEKVRDQLIEWARAASRLGLVDAYRQALEFIEGKLTNEPLNWGDPLYQFRLLQLTMCRGIHWKLAVEYGVNEEKRVVFIKEYRLLRGNPLAADQD